MEDTCSPYFLKYLLQSRQWVLVIHLRLANHCFRSKQTDFQNCHSEGSNNIRFGFPVSAPMDRKWTNSLVGQKYPLPLGMGELGNILACQHEYGVIYWTACFQMAVGKFFGYERLRITCTKTALEEKFQVSCDYSGSSAAEFRLSVTRFPWLSHLLVIFCPLYLKKVTDR